MTQVEFDDWFANPLAFLSATRHGGFAVLMIAIPLIERYLREKSGCCENNLDIRFYREFIKIFTNLSEDQAKDFWQCYRNGLLHQATFSRQDWHGNIMPRAWITSKQPTTADIINYNPTSNCFILLPKEFSEEIVQVIRSDFATFLGPGSVNHPLPAVVNPGSSPTSGAPVPRMIMVLPATGSL